VIIHISNKELFISTVKASFFHSVYTTWGTWFNFLYFCSDTDL